MNDYEGITGYERYPVWPDCCRAAYQRLGLLPGHPMLAGKTVKLIRLVATTLVRSRAPRLDLSSGIGSPHIDVYIEKKPRGLRREALLRRWGQPFQAPSQRETMPHRA